MNTTLSNLLSTLPAEWPQDLLPVIQERLRAGAQKLIVLDDDPTGTQTVHSIPVLTTWPVAQLVEEIKSDSPTFYLLTNSRALPLRQAQELNAETGKRIAAASRQAGLAVSIVSRSDSTLRGHFPGEVDALAQGLGGEFDACLVIPFFIEGGRYTCNDIHYVADGEILVPAGQTEFARDKTFGYQASNLREWVAEKTAGRVPASEVHTISIDTLRNKGPQAVTQQLLGLPKGAVCAVNAMSYRDMEVFVLGLLGAEAAGKRYLYRTAASFVRVRSGITPKQLLTRDDLQLPVNGAGLIMAGSYVPKTSSQLEALFRDTKTAPVEIAVPRLLDAATRAAEIERIAQTANTLLAAGQDAALFTSRLLITADEVSGSTNSTEDHLAIGQIVSDSLVSILRSIQTRPRYLLAKGGITSSVLATDGLGIRRALVLGQVLPGVPVWQSGAESRWPGMPYIVFPGNVGGPGALASVVKGLEK